MKFFSVNDKSAMMPLIARPKDLDDAEFREEIRTADIIIALNSRGDDMKVLWRGTAPGQLVDRIRNVHVAYIGVDFGNSKEVQHVTDAVTRIKGLVDN